MAKPYRRKITNKVNVIELLQENIKEFEDLGCTVRIAHNHLTLPDGDVAKVILPNGRVLRNGMHVLAVLPGDKHKLHVMDFNVFHSEFEEDD